MTVDPAQAAPTAPEQSGPGSWLRDRLRCPVTGEELVDGVGPDGAPALISRGAGLAYPVRDGVPILLRHEAAALS